MSKSTNLLQSASNVDTNGLRDIRPPVVIPSGWEWLWWMLAALVLVLAVAGVVWWWSRRKQLAGAPPPLPAHMRALARLKSALELISRPEPFVMEVSNVTRSYLEERFDFRAPERTTEEFLRELQGSHLLSEDQKTSLAHFLERCDLVKFARYEPTEAELFSLHDAAVNLVEETVPVPALEDSAAAGASQTGAAVSQNPHIGVS